uniref:BRX domain-containing protein n=3 Tax=Araucaria cunninghamii TaxID=56994 RepID=A0A0D6R384_ARACU
MLTCIACSKRLDDPMHETPPDGSSTPRSPASKEAIKNLTAQIKDMALKFSGAYRHCRPCAASSVYRKGTPQHSLEPDDASEGTSAHYGYRPGSSSSTPAWNFSTTGRDHVLGEERFRAIAATSSAEGTPRFESPAVTRHQNTGSLDVVSMEEEEEENKEWVAQVEPGVLITLISLPEGGNDLKRIRFSREMFNKWQAQRWWAENYDKVLELYNIQRFDRQTVLPTREEEERGARESAEDSPVTPPLHNERLPRNFYRQCPPGVGYSSSDSMDHHSSLAATPNLSSKAGSSSMDGDRSDDLSVSASTVSDQEMEWVEEDEPGVYITIRSLPGGGRELRRVRFSREKFGEVQARLWWEENRSRIHRQYL